MLPSLRTALLFCAALGAISFAPAQAQRADEPLNPVTASLPEVPVPDLLDPDGEVQLSDAGTEEAVSPETDQQVVVATKPSSDLSTLVEEYRSADAGSHELEFLLSTDDPRPSISNGCTCDCDCDRHVRRCLRSRQPARTAYTNRRHPTGRTTHEIQTTAPTGI